MRRAAGPTLARAKGLISKPQVGIGSDETNLAVEHRNTHPYPYTFDLPELSMRAIYLLPLLGVGVLGAFLFVGLGLNPREVPSPLIGKPAPTFDLPRLMQPEQRLTNADLQNKVTLVNVWASWCVSCRVEHPLLVDLANSTDVNLIGLNYKDDPDDARRWLAQFGNPYSHSMVDRDGRMGIHWGVYGVPETFVVDSQGVVRHKHIGPLSLQDLTEDILPLVKQLREGG